MLNTPLLNTKVPIIKIRVRAICDVGNAHQGTSEKVTYVAYVLNKYPYFGFEKVLVRTNTLPPLNFAPKNLCAITCYAGD